MCPTGIGVTAGQVFNRGCLSVFTYWKVNALCWAIDEDTLEGGDRQAVYAGGRGKGKDVGCVVPFPIVN